MRLTTTGSKSEISPAGPDAAGELPFVSVVMAIRNEESYIRQTLEAIIAQDYPLELIEIVISDGMSDDGTVGEINGLIDDRSKGGLPTPGIEILENPERYVPTGLNRAIGKAAGSVIVRVDGHVEIDKNYIMECVRALDETDCAVVGGPIDTVGEGTLAEAIALATSSRFGVGNSAFRTSQKASFVDTVPFGTFRKEALVAAGLFDERFKKHQDYELNYRIRKSGGRIFLSPNIRSTYYSRVTTRKLISQYFNYGVWKGRFLRVHPGSLRWRHLVPPSLVACELATLALSLFSPVFLTLFLVVLASYAVFLAAASLTVCRRGGWRMLHLIPLIILLLHHCWGSGVLVGLCTPLEKRATPACRNES